MSSRPKILAKLPHGAARFAPLMDPGAPGAYDRNLLGQQSRKHGMVRKAKKVAKDTSDAGTIVIRKEDTKQTVLGKMARAVGGALGLRRRADTPATRRK